MKENMIYIHRIEGQTLNELEGGISHIEYNLSREHIAIDKGMAVYYQGFTNHFVLVGFLREIFSPNMRGEIVQTAHNIGDYFIIGNGKFCAVWTGVWEPLERIGMCAVTFNDMVLGKTIGEINKSLRENGGKLVDRG